MGMLSIRPKRSFMETGSEKTLSMITDLTPGLRFR